MKKKVSKFNDQFDQPIHFQENDDWVISAELFTREQAHEKFKEEFDTWQPWEGGIPRFKNFSDEELREGRVRFCCQPWEGENVCSWWFGAKGKGSKPVWIFTPTMNPRPN